MPNNQTKNQFFPDLFEIAFMFSMHLTLVDAGEPNEQKNLVTENNWPAFINKKLLLATFLTTFMAINIYLKISNVRSVLQDCSDNLKHLNHLFGEKIGIKWNYDIMADIYCSKIGENHTINLSNSFLFYNIGVTELSLKRENFLSELRKFLQNIGLTLTENRGLIWIKIPKDFNWHRAYISRISKSLTETLFKKFKKDRVKLSEEGRIDPIKQVKKTKKLNNQQRIKKENDSSQQESNQKDHLINQIRILNEQISKLSHEELGKEEQNHIVAVLANSVANANQSGQIGKFAHELKKYAENKSVEWEKNRSVINAELVTLQNSTKSLMDTQNISSLESLTQSTHLCEQKLTKFTEYVRSYRENYKKGIDKLNDLNDKLMTSVAKNEANFKQKTPAIPLTNRTKKIEKHHISNNNSFFSTHPIKKTTKVKFKDNNNNSKAIEVINSPLTSTLPNDTNPVLQICRISSNVLFDADSNKNKIPHHHHPDDSVHDWRHILLESFHPMMPFESNDFNNLNKSPIFKYSLHYDMLKIFAKARKFSQVFDLELTELDKTKFSQWTNLIFEYQETSTLMSALWTGFIEYLFKDFSPEEKNNPTLASIEKNNSINKNQIWLAFHQGILHNDEIILGIEDTNQSSPRDSYLNKLITAIENFRLLTEPIKTQVDLFTYSNREHALEMLLANIGFYCGQLLSKNSAFFKLNLIDRGLVDKLIKFKNHLIYFVFAEERVDREKLFYFKRQIDNIDISALKHAKQTHDVYSIFVTPPIHQPAVRTSTESTRATTNTPMKNSSPSSVF